MMRVLVLCKGRVYLKPRYIYIGMERIPSVVGKLLYFVNQMCHQRQITAREKGSLKGIFAP
jgi:hypothetical protein